MTPKILSAPSNNAALLQTYTQSSSGHGFCSMLTLIVGKTSAVLVDPPFMIADAEALLKWIKTITNNPITAIFTSHHHPDHFWSANIVIESYPSAKLYAAPYILNDILSDILKEYEAKPPFVQNLLGAKASMRPTKPEPYPWSFFLLDGNASSPIMLLGPMQGDYNSTIFWLPAERTLIAGDIIYARDIHIWSGHAGEGLVSNPSSELITDTMNTGAKRLRAMQSSKRG
jgi:glyoxylase-like metal-dependent hydrolase (beta-lactamase superfamily II)